MMVNEVNAAFEILLEEIEAVTDNLNEAGAEALRAGDYEKAQKAIEEAIRLATFREKVKQLQKEWTKLFPSQTELGKRRTRRRVKSRLPRGLRTPEDAFRRPILESLIELGGRAQIGEVLDRVGQRMEHLLNEYDRESLPSNPRFVRWRNTAQWCRNTLVREGLMRNDSPHGVWEISEKGRAWLQRHRPE